MGIPYTGAGYLGSGLAMDKDLTKRLIAHLGVHTPQWQRVSYTEQEVEDLAAGHPGALRGEPVASGSSIGVSIAHTRQELHGALMEGLRFGGQCVLEQYVAGREIQVAILAGRRCPPLRLSPKRDFMIMKTSISPARQRRSAPPPSPPRGNSGWGRRP